MSLKQKKFFFENILVFILKQLTNIRIFSSFSFPHI
jgi:hypothetical protein